MIHKASKILMIPTAVLVVLLDEVISCKFFMMLFYKFFNAFPVKDCFLIGSKCLYYFIINAK